MNFTGRTWRPPYEAYTPIIPVTSGCTYNKCNFCNLYHNECFRMLSMVDFERDLEELKGYQPNARRVFWTGANPFAMSYDNLKLRALTTRDYLIKCQSIAMFASIRDIVSKTPAQLRKLRAMGINGLSIGTESGDDQTLLIANKGYTSIDILEQCQKLDEAGIEYYFVYMTGLSGKGNGVRNAVNSVKIFNQLNPYFISIDSLTLFPGTKMYEMEQRNSFVPAGEYERIEELITLIQHLQIRVHLQADSKSNFYPVVGNLPKEGNKIIELLKYIMKTTSEEEMMKYRRELISL